MNGHSSEPGSLWELLICLLGSYVATIAEGMAVKMPLVQKIPMKEKIVTVVNDLGIHRLRHLTLNQCRRLNHGQPSCSSGV